MILLIKVAFIAIGLLVGTAAHLFWKGNPQEQVIEKVVEEVVDAAAGIDITEMQTDIDSVVDVVEKK